MTARTLTPMSPIADHMTEAALQAQVTRLAQACGWLVYHTHDSRRSQPGFPDLVLVRGTELLYRELKTQRGRVRPEQRRWLDALTAAGVDAAVWRPQHLYDRTIERHLVGREHP